MSTPQFQSQGYGKSAGTGGQFNGYQRKDRPYYTFYHRVGHVVDRCYKKHGFPTSFKPNQRPSSSPSFTANVAVTESAQRDSGVSEDLSPDQIQQLVSFLSNKLQPPVSHPISEVHFVSASIPSSSNTCPISGTFYPSVLVLLPVLIGLMSVPLRVTLLLSMLG